MGGGEGERDLSSRNLYERRDCLHSCWKDPVAVPDTAGFESTWFDDEDDVLFIGDLLLSDVGLGSLVGLRCV
jgi:hypothetical protein